jgi:hypothetical protein
MAFIFFTGMTGHNCKEKKKRFNYNSEWEVPLAIPLQGVVHMVFLPTGVSECRVEAET